MKEWDHVNFKLLTPVYATQNVEVGAFMRYLKTKLRHAKEDNKYFNWGYDRFEIAFDEDGSLVLQCSKSSDEI